MLSNRMFHSEKCLISVLNRGFPGSSDSKESTCNARDLGLIPWFGRSPGEWHGHSLQYSYLENPHGQGSPRLHSMGTKRVGHNWGTKHTYTVQHASHWSHVTEWVSESRSVVSDSLRPHGLYSPWNSPGQNTGVVSLSLLQGIFPTQGSNPGLPHCRRSLYQLSYQAGANITNE